MEKETVYVLTFRINNAIQSLGVYSNMKTALSTMKRMKSGMIAGVKMEKESFKVLVSTTYVYKIITSTETEYEFRIFTKPLN